VTRAKQSKSHTGKRLKEETKQKLSFANSGERHYCFGKHLSEGTKRKLSIINTGKRLNEKTRNKISESIRGEKNPNFGKPLPARA
jgi:hypothetical protein